MHGHLDHPKRAGKDRSTRDSVYGTRIYVWCVTIEHAQLEAYRLLLAANKCRPQLPGGKALATDRALNTLVFAIYATIRVFACVH